MGLSPNSDFSKNDSDNIVSISALNTIYRGICSLKTYFAIAPFFCSAVEIYF